MYDKIVRVPAFVLSEWAALADEFYESDSPPSTKLLSNALAYMWSDHRPVWVQIFRKRPLQQQYEETAAAEEAGGQVQQEPEVAEQASTEKS